MHDCTCACVALTGSDMHSLCSALLICFSWGLLISESCVWVSAVYLVKLTTAQAAQLLLQPLAHQVFWLEFQMCDLFLWTPSMESDPFFPTSWPHETVPIIWLLSSLHKEIWLNCSWCHTCLIFCTFLCEYREIGAHMFYFRKLSSSG